MVSSINNGADYAEWNQAQVLQFLSVQLLSKTTKFVQQHPKIPHHQLWVLYELKDQAYNVVGNSGGGTGGIKSI